MHNRHTHIAQNPSTLLLPHNVHQHLPTLLIQIQLEKVVETAIACDFEFGTYAECGAGGLCEDDGADDAVAVAGEVEGPLVEGAAGFVSLLR